MRNTLLIIKKEIKDYFTSPIAYVVIAAFLVIVGVIFAKDVFLDKQASMRNVFEFIPQILIIVIPALTMRSWAEERKEGTLEVISTLPISNLNLIIAKFVSCLFFTSIAIILTAPIPLTLNLIGNPDNGIILAGYFALILLSASYIALGQFISINTKNQIVAFIVAASLIGTLYLFGEAQFLVFIPKSIRFIFEALGLGSHFRSIAKGVLDSRDILYYFSIIILLFYFTYRSLLRIKRIGK
jgi:ABC-2 type transport system permease protein